ncbi:MAG TPA: enolase C-terminal domain-like protein [Polyangiaceae bacterium]|nr:enolase C-terminal domain-like protein [Polyangiaceae bacterium]
MPRITHFAFRPFDVVLTEPFGIASGAQAVAENLLVEVGLEGGALGLGEAAPFPAFNGETRADVERALEAARERLLGLEAATWRRAAATAKQLLRAAPSALCAFETALLDAFTRSLGVSLFAFFGGAEPELVSDITLTTGSPEQAAAQAASAHARGFRTLKAKVGGAPLVHDLERLSRAAAAAPDAAFILDANASLRPEEAIRLLRALGALRDRVVLFEQPTAAKNLQGLRAVREAGVRVAADESAASLEDLARLIEADAADVVNVKIMKSGLVTALDMALGARAAGLELMIGGLVETRLAMTTSACLAGGLGGFSYVDLDTPLFMENAPFKGGFADEWPRLGLAAVELGHGVLS